SGNLSAFKSVTVASRPLQVVSAHDHPHDEKHSHTHALPSKGVTFKSLLTLGIGGGVVPRPDAIATLPVALPLNRLPLGMLLSVAFSIGLAAVLIAIGIAMVQGARLIARNDLLTRFGIYTPVISALVVLGLGTGLTISAWNSLRFAKTVSQAPGQQVSVF